MPVNNSSMEEIMEYLKKETGSGMRYYRAKDIAASLNLTPKMVGYHLSKLADSCNDFAISQWGYSKSTSWKVEPKFMDANTHPEVFTEA